MEFTQHEVTFLSDAVSMFSQGPSPEVRAYPDLLLKIGAAFLEVATSRPGTSIVLTKDELWMVREVAKTGVTVGAEKVGLNLLVKTYQGLRELYADDQLHAAILQFGEKVDGTDSPSREDYKARLSEWAQRGGGSNAGKS